MPIYIYQILHITGIMLLFLGCGALLARSLSGSSNARLKKLGSTTSGIGLLLILVAGFALISKQGHSFTDIWLIVKLAIWLDIAVLISFINRKPAAAAWLWWALLGLGALAAVMVYVRPFS